MPLLTLLAACPSTAHDTDDLPSTAATDATGSAPTTSDGPTTTAPPTTDASTGTSSDDETTSDPVDPACAVPDAPPSSGPSTSGPWRLEQLDLAEHPTAVCNDGTAGLFMIRRNEASTRWLVFFEGGGNCHDGASCKNRWNSAKGLDLMSALSVLERHEEGTLAFPDAGIFAPDAAVNAALHDANYVMVPYCSSDLWSGDREGDLDLPLGDVARWHFRGRAIARAVIAELLMHEGLDAATDVVLGGSAGAAGLYVLVDELAAELPAGARVLGLADAGYQIVYPAFDPETGLESEDVPTPVEAIALAGHDNWGGRGDESCDATAATEEARVYCRSAEHLVHGGHITTPLLIVNTQYDFNQTTRLGVTVTEDHHVPDPQENALVVRFAAAMRERLADIDPQHSVFADYSSLHVTCNRDLMSDVEIDGVTLAEAIADWHRSPCTVRRRIEAPIRGLP